MLSKQVLPWLLMALFTGACASSKSAERPEPPPPPILFKSSLALLLEHHAELKLTTDQMIAVGQLNSALQEKNKPLRMKLRELRPVGPPPRRGPAMDGPPPGVDPRRWGGGRPRGPWTGMGAGQQPPEVPPETDEAREQRRRQIEALLKEMEDNETAAYAEAEKALDETQRTRAGELVAQLHEQRRKAREAPRAPPEPAPASEPAPEPQPEG
jgi:hypothetical protein